MLSVFLYINAKIRYMKKVLRFIGVLLLVLVAGFLILCITAPKETVVEKNIVINAPKEIAWEQMVNFGNWSHWSPWQEKDSTIVVTLSGQQGLPGSSYSWTSKNSGTGTVTSTKLEGTKMSFDMVFKEPWESKADGYVMVEPAGTQTKATWAFHAANTFLSGGIMKLMGMMGMSVGNDFERGLQLLKEYSEKHAADAPASNFNIETIQFPAHNYACIKTTLTINDMQAMHQFFGEAYAALGKAAGQRITGPASALYYTWDEKTGKTDMAAAFPVSGNEPVADAVMQAVAASKAYQVSYQGGYEGSGKAHEALTRHIAANGEKQQLVIEEYLRGPGEEKDSTKWLTNIIYLVK